MFPTDFHEKYKYSFWGIGSGSSNQKLVCSSETSPFTRGGGLLISKIFS